MQFGNKPTAFPELVEKVKKHLKRGMTAIYGLEDTGGYGRALAVFLKENKHVVKVVNPALVAFRRGSKTNKEKSDRLDAEYVARILKDELHRLPDANPIDTIRRGLVEDYWLQ
ncbi:IS110 family transposase [Paenibacillus kobensis]|uniref:IS110 family transposase n=1 Tax=Paenibacillus kobensis TaxID=59841 RepID=UPI000FD7F15D|nr:transposase [Paenibacillus kobensis]